jgi:hypothetical protein
MLCNQSSKRIESLKRLRNYDAFWIGMNGICDC